MPKKNSNKNYLELMLFSLLILDAYLYSRTNGDDKYNDPYNYPHKTLYNWAPTALVSLLLTSTFLTSLILMLNPQAEREGSKTSNKSIDNILLYAPAIMALAQKAGSLLTTTFLGERAKAINSVTDAVIAKTEVATHVIISQREIHDDLIARSIPISEDQEYQIRQIEKIGHLIVVTYVTSIEALAAYMITTGLVTRYIPPAKGDSESTEIGKFLSWVSLANLIGKTLINDHFLALKIMIDKPIISKILNMLYLAGRGAITFKNTDFLDKVAQVSGEFATEIAKAFKEFEENTVEFLLKRKAELESQIEAFVSNIKELGETIKEQTQKFALEVEKQAREFGSKIEKQSALIEAKILEITKLNRLLDEANKIREALEQELQQIKQRLQEFEAKIKEGAEHVGEAIVEAAKYTQEELDKAATKLQAHFRGFSARKHLQEVGAKKSLEDEASQPKAKTGGEEVSVDSKADSKIVQPTDGGAAHHDEKESQPKHDHHRVLHAIEDGLSRVGHSLASAFHPHTSSSGSSAGKVKADAKKESSTAAANKGSSDSAGGAKTDKASNEEYTIYEQSYINLNNSTQSPVITIDFSRVNQGGVKNPAPTNKEREEYEAAKAAAESSNKTRVEYHYEGVVLERPEFYTVPKKYGMGEEISNNLDNPALMGDNFLYAM